MLVQIRANIVYGVLITAWNIKKLIYLVTGHYSCLMGDCYARYTYNKNCKNIYFNLNGVFVVL